MIALLSLLLADLRGRGFGFSRWSMQELRHIPYIILNPITAGVCLLTVLFGGNLAAGGAGANDAIIVLSDATTCVTGVTYSGNVA